VLKLSGSCNALMLGDLLEWLHMARGSGRLLLTAGTSTRAFDIVHGKVAFATSSRASERLASWLLRKDLVPRPALIRALALSQTQGEPFTAVLERDSGVPHDMLVEAGRSLATALASRVLREHTVEFHFDPTWPVSERLLVDLRLECSKLIMQAAYTVDTRPPQDSSLIVPRTSLDPVTMEQVFWRVIENLENDPLEGPELAATHRSLLAVGELLNRWVTQGPPLLPLGPDEVERVRERMTSGSSPTLEDSPTLAWDLLALVNALDAPGSTRAMGLEDAWLLGGDDSPWLVELILSSPRWRRQQRTGTDISLRRLVLARAAAARTLAGELDVSADTASTAAVLPVVMLELVYTALASAPLGSQEIQRQALRRLLPLVGHAAGGAAGLPPVLLAALTGDPAEHVGARLAGLVNLALEGAGSVCPGSPPPDQVSGALASALEQAQAAGRDKAAHAAESR
jgi:hypothetical protein